MVQTRITVFLRPACSVTLRAPRPSSACFSPLGHPRHPTLTPRHLRLELLMLHLPNQAPGSSQELGSCSTPKLLDGSRHRWRGEGQPLPQMGPRDLLARYRGCNSMNI